jgi:hypothetical protein
MRQKPNHSESPGESGADVDKPLTKEQAKEAMAKFKLLTRQLLSVSRERLRVEQDHYEKSKKSK